MNGNDDSSERRAKGLGSSGSKSGNKASQAQDEITVPELAGILYRRRIPFFFCVAAGLIVALLITFTLPKRYEAVGQLTIDFKPSPSSGVEALAQAAGVSDPTKLQTQVNIIETDSMAWEVIRRLRLDQKVDALPRSFGVGAPECLTPLGRDAGEVSNPCKRSLLDEFHKRLRVQALPRTEILEIRYRSRSPELAVQVVDAVASIYMEHNFDSSYRSSLRASDWLSGQVGSLKKEEEDAEQRLLRFQKQTGLIQVQGGPNLELTQLNAVSQQLLAARAQQLAQEARYRTALTGDPEAMVGITQGSALQALHAEEIAIGNQYAQLEAKYGDAYPKVIQIKEQLDKAKQATQVELAHQRSEIKLEYDAATRDEELSQSAFDAQKQDLLDKGEASIQLAVLQRDVEIANELYEQVLKRMRLGTITAGLNALDVEVVDPPQLPTRKIEPHPALNAAAGLLIGALLGFGVCALLEATDQRVAMAKEVERLCPMPGVGIIPGLSARDRSDRAAARNPLFEAIALDYPNSPTAEGSRALRTSLLHTVARPVPRVILISSPAARNAKSAAAVNLAVVFAQMGRRVLLVDADLRGTGFSASRPSSASSLAQLLAGGTLDDRFTSIAELPGLSILPAGTSSANPADLLDSETMRSELKGWRSEFDVILLEAPPVLGGSDALVLATMVDTTVLTLQLGTCRLEDLRSALELVDSIGAHVSGTILLDRRNSRAPRDSFYPPASAATEQAHA